jgi:serine/threonine protein kinase
MDLTNIKVIKELGTGMYATTYLVDYKGKKYALKKQKILAGNRNRSSRSITWREIFFFEYVNKMPLDTQKFFCKLYAFKIEDNCKHTQIRPKNIQKNANLKAKMNQINASNICANFLIEYKGNMTLYDFMGTKLSAKQIYTILLQLCKIIFVMSDALYSHNNVHLGNFMVLPNSMQQAFLCV